LNPTFTPKAKEGAEKRFPDGTVDWFEPNDFQIDYNKVERLDLIAKGSYGTVYKARWKNELVAIKLEDFYDGDEEQVNLLVELTMLQSFPHERMVKFIGAGCIVDSTTIEKKVIPFRIIINILVRIHSHLLNLPADDCYGVL
jgi:hypothetical protein